MGKTVSAVHDLSDHKGHLSLFFGAKRWIQVVGVLFSFDRATVLGSSCRFESVRIRASPLTTPGQPRQSKVPLIFPSSSGANKVP